MVIGYKVVDAHTGKVIREYGILQAKAAGRMADKLSLAYGAARYERRAILA